MSTISPTGPRRASGRSTCSNAVATGWRTPRRGSTPGTSGWSRSGGADRSRTRWHATTASVRRCLRPSRACRPTTSARRTVGAGPTTACTATPASTWPWWAPGAPTGVAERAGLMATAAASSTAAGLSVEAIVAIEAPREFRLHPRDRVVAYTAESAGARQLFTLTLRGGHPIQVTASEQAVSDPQWSPDGRRLAYVRDDEIWVVEAGRVTLDAGGRQAGRRDRAPLVARRRAPGVPVETSWLVADLGHRGSRSAPRPSGPRPQAARRPGRDRSRARCRFVRVGAGRRPTGGHGPARSRPTRSPSRSPSSTSRPASSEIVAGSDGCATGGRWLAGRVAAVRQR